MTIAATSALPTTALPTTPPPDTAPHQHTATAHRDTSPRALLLAAIRQRQPGLAEIHDEDSLSNLGLDSLDRIALAAVLERATGHPLSDQAVADAHTIADLLACTVALATAPAAGPGAATPRAAAPPAPMPAVPKRSTAEPSSDPAAAALSSGHTDDDHESRGWVDPGGLVGPGTRLWHQAQVSVGAHVGAGCTLGKGVFIGAGSAIGDHVKIGNGVNVFGATVADEAMICPGALLLEDPAPRATTPDGRRKSPADFTRRPVAVGRGATVGAAAVLAPGVTVGAYALVAVGAVVVRDVFAHALVAGNPARQCGWVCRCGHTLDEQHRCPACARSYVRTGDQLAEAGTDQTGQVQP
jgi:acetyltransferase-like isoleucine patch superfamily enzyme/acyl carrier protein